MASTGSHSFSNVFIEQNRITALLLNVTACAAAISCCISDVPSQWEGQKFDPHAQLPHFSIDLNETQNQERYPKYDPACKIWLIWDNGKGSAKMANFGLLSALSFLYSSPRFQTTP